MNNYYVILTWEAINDAVDILEYIEAEFGVERANHYQGKLRDQIKNLEFTGNIFAKTHISCNGYSVYKKPFSPSIIFYLIKEQEKEVHVLRILREERDWYNLLLEHQNYTYP